MDAERLERDFFRTLNAFVEPAVRAGLGGPCLIPAGLIVLETTGRITGRPRRTPLLASVVDGCLILATFRPRSHWVRNAAANPHVRYWLNGQERHGRATVILPGQPVQLPATLPPLVRGLAENLLVRSTELGWSIAIVEPNPA